LKKFVGYQRQEEVAEPMGSRRTERRILVGTLGQLEVQEKPHDSECAWIENISDRGARVISRRPWRSGERLVISSRYPPFRSASAGVVYCQTLLDGLYAIGCEASAGGVLQLFEQMDRSSDRDPQTLENPVAAPDRSGPLHASA
jgi:hypothetical protein